MIAMHDNEGGTPPHRPTREGLIIMTDYTTRTLAEKIMPEAAEKNIKGATRELRKFLRDELGDGRAVVGKGNRYALSYNAKEITALKKKFAAWQVAQQEAAAARRAARDEAAKITVEDAPEVIEDDATDEAQGPSDEEIAAMLSDATDED